MTSSLLSLVWWVAIGLVFFWLMSRGGCGMMMMGHGRGRDREKGHGDGHAARSASGKPLDPVCGMEVDPAKAAGTRVVMGETYFLCSQNCLDAFDKNSAMYTQQRETQPPAHRHAGC